MASDDSRVALDVGEGGSVLVARSVAVAVGEGAGEIVGVFEGTSEGVAPAS